MVQEGTATFTAGDETIEAKGGQVVVVLAGDIFSRFAGHAG